MALKLFIEDGQTDPAAQYVDDGTPPVGYTDKDSDIPSWSKYGQRARKDFLFVKEKLRSLLEAIAGSDWSTFSSLTQEQKEIAIEWCNDYVLQADFESEEPDSEKRDELIAKEDRNEKEAIENRIQEIDICVRKFFKQADMQSVFDKIAGDNLYEKYRIQCQHIRHYFDSTDDYVGTGLRDSGYVPRTGGTLTQVCDKLVDLVTNGK